MQGKSSTFLKYFCCFFSSLSLQQLFQNDSLLAVRTNGDNTQLNTGYLADFSQIFFSVFRQLVIVTDAADVGHPAVELFENRLNLSQNVQACRNAFENLIANLVANAHFNLRHIVEDIQTGNCQIIQAVQACAVTQHESIQPAAATRTTGYGAVFMAGFADLVAGAVCIQQLGDEGTFTNAGGISLNYADNMVDEAGTYATAGADE